jgi:hypothetical protein
MLFITPLMRWIILIWECIFNGNILCSFADLKFIVGLVLMIMYLYHSTMTHK